MDARLQTEAIATAREVATGLAGLGATAVVLVGSFARGDASPESDLDLYAIGEGPAYRLERRGRFLISVNWRTAEGERQAFRDPARAGVVVPAWRGALILHDPDGLAANLQTEARAWTWAVVGDEACNRYVADKLTGLAEEVHKLVTLIETGCLIGAAVQRSILALQLEMVVAVHLRLHYDSENRLWDLVGERMGDEWRRAQAASLGLSGEAFVVTCQAALELYSMAARRTWELFDERERAVVEHACRIAGFSLES